MKIFTIENFSVLLRLRLSSRLILREQLDMDVLQQLGKKCVNRDFTLSCVIFISKNHQLSHLKYFFFSNSNCGFMINKLQKVTYHFLKDLLLYVAAQFWLGNFFPHMYSLLLGRSIFSNWICKTCFMSNLLHFSVSFSVAQRIIDSRLRTLLSFSLSG